MFYCGDDCLVVVRWGHATLANTLLLHGASPSIANASDLQPIQVTQVRNSDANVYSLFLKRFPRLLALHNLVAGV